MFPVTRSLLSTDALRETTLAKYDMGEIADVRLFKLGLNDTYFVEASGVRYVLRIYRAGWRTESEIRFELDALHHLKEAGAPISFPIASRDGSYLHAIEAPEGARWAALFTYADNEAADPDIIARAFGTSVAAIHAGAEDFVCDHHRSRLDLDFLIWEPLKAMMGHLRHRPNDAAYLQSVAERIDDAITALPAGLDSGFCHGDVHGGNAGYRNGVATFFDFDCCGLGWRAYDLAVFRWNGHHAAAEIRNWDAFLDGYRVVRPLSDANLTAVPLFVIARQIWYMGLLAGLSSDFGAAIAGDHFWDANIAFLRAREEEFLASRCAPTSRIIAS